MSLSLAQKIAALPPESRSKALEGEDAAELLHAWPFWARPDQLEPGGDWATWLVLAGRGWGKSRCGAEWVKSQVEHGRARRVALVAPTAADARDVMIEGESGILAISNPKFRPLYEPSKRRLTWPNGAIATAYSADRPDRLRGPQHDAAWADEPAAWRFPDAWDMLMFGLRLGDRPRCVATTTPRPVRVIRELVADQTCHVTRGSTYDNRANLAPSFFQKILAKYEGTTLGRQEIHAELLSEARGALWSRDLIDLSRVEAMPTRIEERELDGFEVEVPDIIRTVVAIDPAVTAGEESDETGIVAASKCGDGHAYVTHDLSCRMSPMGWSKRAIQLYGEIRADRIVAEVNQGGDMVESTLRTHQQHVSYRAVRASRGKRARAEPIAALYEQGKVHHVGSLEDLEDQLCNVVPGESYGLDDRHDALVWALTDLMLEPEWRIL